MITFYAAMETVRQPEIPEWMREERYMYCEQTIRNLHSYKMIGIYEKIKKLFA